MAQTKRRCISHVCGLALCGGKKEGRISKMDNVDNFTINLAITVIVLFIGLALMGGEDD